MSSAANFAQYIGAPWEAGAQGPDAYDCMSFFKLVQAQHFGVFVPSIIAADYENPHELAGLFKSHEERSRWSKMPAPKHGAAVIVHNPMHIGTWLDIDGGGVLHCVRGSGVIFTQDGAWHVSGFGRREYFEVKA
jgi:hypothetical protein